jgi:predicted kinase
MKIYELTARFDARNSFYHKAMVGVTKNTTTLFAYETTVASIKKGKLKLLDAWNSSNTTRRHLQDFVIQHNMEAQFEELKKSFKKGN